MKPVHRILFLRTDRLGDVLMNLPAIHLLRQSFPKAWICLLADEAVAPLFRGHADLDEVMPLKTALFKSSVRYRLDCLKKIKKAGFDLAIVSNPDKNLHGLVFLAGIRTRVGVRRKWAFLLTQTLFDDKAENSKHEIDSNLNLVKLVTDTRWDGQCFLTPEPEAVEKVVSRLSALNHSGRGFIAVHAGTSNPGKKWPEENFAAVCRWAALQNFSVILVSGTEEAPVSQSVARQSGAPVSDWTGSLSLQELAALFHDRRVKALVSSDSGPVHVAWLSGTPVVALYAQDVPGSNPARWGPRDNRSLVLYKPLSEITAGEVCEKLKKVLLNP